MTDKNDSCPWVLPKVFKSHPAPWTYCPKAAECGNGGSIDVIEDANGNAVASSYNGGFYELWQMYCILTPEQEIELGAKE